MERQFYCLWWWYPNSAMGHRESHNIYIKDNPQLEIITNLSHFPSGLRMDVVPESILEMMISSEFSETHTQNHRIDNMELPLNPSNNPDTLYITYSQ
jgi:hypothetical protein